MKNWEHIRPAAGTSRVFIGLRHGHVLPITGFGAI